MAEWSIAAVLKTVVLRGTGGSNPSLSAKRNGKGASSLLERSFFISFCKEACGSEGWTCHSLSLRRTPKTKGGQIKTNPVKP